MLLVVQVIVVLFKIFFSMFGNFIDQIRRHAINLLCWMFFIHLLNQIIGQNRFLYLFFSISNFWSFVFLKHEFSECHLILLPCLWCLDRLSWIYRWRLVSVPVNFKIVSLVESIRRFQLFTLWLWSVLNAFKFEFISKLCNFSSWKCL